MPARRSRRRPRAAIGMGLREERGVPPSSEHLRVQERAARGRAETPLPPARGGLVKEDRALQRQEQVVL